MDEETQFTYVGNDNALLRPLDTAALIGDGPVEAGRDVTNDTAHASSEAALGIAVPLVAITRDQSRFRLVYP